MDLLPDADGWPGGITNLRCHKCRYSLQTLKFNEVCPECGVQVVVSIREHLRTAKRRRILSQEIPILFWANVVIGMWLLVPIAAYHINGRAFYDYGIQGWNPPPSVVNGTIAVGDYDPKCTRPFNWPVVGGPMEALSDWSMLLFCPPIAPAISVALLVNCLVAAGRNDLRRRLLLWGLSSMPVVYAIIWGSHVAEWLAD